MPRPRWNYNIKLDLGEIVCVGRDWINLTQDKDQLRALAKMAMNLRLLKTLGYS
jgi:hypothetical protein